MTPQHCIAIMAAIIKTTQPGPPLESSDRIAVNQAIVLWHLVTTETDELGEPR